MNREIKFNAFLSIGDGALEVMLEDVTIYPDGTMGIFSEHFEEALKPTGWTWDNSDDCFRKGEESIDGWTHNIHQLEDTIYFKGIPLQYTGYKDKNDKEIYEGHIVKCNRYEPAENYGVIIRDIRSLPSELFGSNLNYREIIGNIYQNKDILKQ